MKRDIHREEGVERRVCRRFSTGHDLERLSGQIYPDEEPVVKRGAITVAFDPIVVRWRGRYVPLSQVEANLFALIVKRGRLMLSELDIVLREIDANPSTRSHVLGHIRGKFKKIGACDPFERLGREIIGLRVDADEIGSLETVIGLQLPRYAKVQFNSLENRD